ncbi:4Fe-4S binding protein, partial [Actinomycetaceae bacterium L2_0104]
MGVSLTVAGAGYGFVFDQSLCNGCKACQVACKDKHD